VDQLYADNIGLLNTSKVAKDMCSTKDGRSEDTWSKVFLGGVGEIDVLDSTLEAAGFHDPRLGPRGSRILDFLVQHRPPLQTKAELGKKAEQAFAKRSIGLTKMGPGGHHFRHLENMPLEATIDERASEDLWVAAAHKEYSDGLEKRWGVENVKGNYEQLKDALAEVLSYRRLEVYSRYGDYIADRLRTLRPKLGGSTTVEDDLRPEQYWSDMSAALRREELSGATNRLRQADISKAAVGLGWDHKLTLYMVHEYATRNTLVHADLDRHLQARDWNELGQCCERDLAIIDTISKTTTSVKWLSDFGQWRAIITEYRDDYLYRPAESCEWLPRLIIREGIAAGIEEPGYLKKLAQARRDLTPEQLKAIQEGTMSLTELAKLQKDRKNLSPAERNKIIRNMNAEKDQANKARLKAEKTAQTESALRTQNTALRLALKRLQVRGERNGLAEELVATTEKLRELEVKVGRAEKKEVQDKRIIEELRKKLQPPTSQARGAGLSAQ
jgi:hypothetical protein